MKVLTFYPETVWNSLEHFFSFFLFSSEKLEQFGTANFNLEHLPLQANTHLSKAHVFTFY